MKGAGLAGSRPFLVEEATVKGFHPPRAFLLQRLHFAASVRKGRRLSKSGPASPPTPEPGCRPRWLSAGVVALALTWSLVLVLLGDEAATRLGQS